MRTRNWIDSRNITNSKHSVTHHTLNFFFYLKEIFFLIMSHIYPLKIENKTQKCVKKNGKCPQFYPCVDRLFVFSSFMWTQG